MNITPLEDRVIVKPFEAAEKTSGGIIIPTTAQEKTQEGLVVAIGTSDKIKVKVKDKVIHDKYAGTTIKIDGDDHIILKSEDIIALIH